MDDVVFTRIHKCTLFVHVNLKKHWRPRALHSYKGERKSVMPSTSRVSTMNLGNTSIPKAINFVDSKPPSRDSFQSLDNSPVFASPIDSKEKLTKSPRGTKTPPGTKSSDTKKDIYTKKTPDKAAKSSSKGGRK